MVARSRIKALAAGTLIVGVLLAGALPSAADTPTTLQVATGDGNPPELVKTVPISRQPGGKKRVVLSVDPPELGRCSPDPRVGHRRARGLGHLHRAVGPVRRQALRLQSPRPGTRLPGPRPALHGRPADRRVEEDHLLAAAAEPKPSLRAGHRRPQPPHRQPLGDPLRARALPSEPRPERLPRQRPRGRSARDRRRPGQRHRAGQGTAERRRLPARRHERLPGGAQPDRQQDAPQRLSP